MDDLFPPHLPAQLFLFHVCAFAVRRYAMLSTWLSNCYLTFNSFAFTVQDQTVLSNFKNMLLVHMSFRICSRSVWHRFIDQGQGARATIWLGILQKPCVVSDWGSYGQVQHLSREVHSVSDKLNKDLWWLLQFLAGGYDLRIWMLTHSTYLRLRLCHVWIFTWCRMV